MSGEAEYNECPETLHGSDIDRLSHAYIELQCFKVHNYVSITLSKYCNARIYASLEDSEGSESTWEWCLAYDL